MHLTFVRLSAILLALLVGLVSVEAQTQKPQSGKPASASGAPPAPRKGYQLFRVFQDRFTFEYPSKDWEMVAGGANSLVTLVQKKREATVVVEYQPLQLELAPNEIDENFGKLEVEPLNARQVDINGVGMRLVDQGERRIIVVDFSRKGVTGMERVRQYSLPIGKHLYRLVCSAPTASFAKYDPVFAAIVESFRPAAAAPSPSAANAPAPER